jgi:hypothetical protein
LGEIALEILAYADDMAVICRNEKELTPIIWRLEDSLQAPTSPE